MTTVWTKEAANIFAALDGSLKPRMIDAGEAATWGGEVEAAINALENRIGTGGLLTPTTNDAAALGTSAVAWADLFLATGGVVNFGAGDVTITHAANTLTIDGASSGVKANDPFTACADDVIPAGGTAGLGLMFSSTANFGIFFGSGAPTLAAAKGSLYMRSDGSSTSTRAYVNTNGSTTWANLTASA